MTPHEHQAKIAAQILGSYNNAPIQKSGEEGDIAKGHTVLPDGTIRMHKGGEGSKGGKVIGHTKSGKPIYDTFSHEGHKSFTKKDHMEASLAHSKANQAKDISDDEFDHHWEEGGKHATASKAAK